jgi:hypothetical protein
MRSIPGDAAAPDEVDGDLLHVLQAAPETVEMLVVILGQTPAPEAVNGGELGSVL